MSAPIISARGLTRRFGQFTAVREVDFDVERGEIFGYLGANGAGKTTTINLFLSFLEPSSGKALVKGIDVHDQPIESKRFIAYIPEQVHLYKNLSGLENLSYFTALAGRGELEKSELLEYFERVGLTAEVAAQRVATYSKGMRQKVGIAIALAKKAEALLLDEPTSGLDPKAANEFSELLKKLSSEGVAVLMATHDLFRAKEAGTRVGIMKHGRMVDTLGTADVGHADLERIYLEHMHD